MCECALQKNSTTRNHFLKRILNPQKGFVKAQDSLKIIIERPGNFFEGFVENLRNLKKVQTLFQSAKPF